MHAVWKEDVLLELRFGFAASDPRRATLKQAKVEKEICEYFAGRRTQFSVPLEPTGSAFQKKVWKALVQIPYGSTRTYSEIAQAIGQPRAQRAVGNAIGKNPLLVLIPCHRVVRTNGELGGFSAGKSLKPRLLSLENARFSN